MRVKTRPVNLADCTKGDPVCTEITACGPTGTLFPPGCVGSDAFPGFIPAFTLPDILHLTTAGLNGASPQGPNCPWANATVPLVRGTMGNATDENGGNVYVFPGHSLGVGASAVGLVSCPPPGVVSRPVWYYVGPPGVPPVSGGCATMLLLIGHPGESVCLVWSVRHYTTSVACGQLYAGGESGISGFIRSVSPLYLPFPGGGDLGACCDGTGPAPTSVITE